MVLLTEHQPKSTTENNSIRQSTNVSERKLSNNVGLTLLYIPELAAALKELGVPHPGEAAVYLSQQAFWMKTNSGIFDRAGIKWIYNSYSQWVEQIASLSEYQFGKMVRALEGLGLIFKSCYAHLRHNLETKPEGFHPWQTKSWITLNTPRIVELTGWNPFGTDVLFDKESPQPATSAEIANTTTRDCVHNDARLRTQFPSIYRENSISTKDEQVKEKEGDVTTKEGIGSLQEDLWADAVEETQDLVVPLVVKNPFTEQSDSQFVKSSALAHTTETTNNTKLDATCSLNTTKIAIRDVSDCVEKRTPSLKGLDVKRSLYVWEDALGRPNEIFLNWWASRHYKPQGGKWETGARSYAYSEFYNNPARADVIYQEFLQFFDTVANNAHQQQNQDIQAILPSCLIQYPEVNQENKEQVASNIATVAARGAGVALPNNVPGSKQHISISFAASGASIAPLPNLEKPVLLNTAQPHFEIALEKLTKQVETANKGFQRYKGDRAQRHKFQEMVRWAKQTEGVVVTDEGIFLAPSSCEENLQQPPEIPLLETPVPDAFSDNNLTAPITLPVEETATSDNHRKNVEEVSSEYQEITETEIISGNVQIVSECLSKGEYDLLATFFGNWDDDIKGKVLSILTAEEREQVEKLENSPHLRPIAQPNEESQPQSLSSLRPIAQPIEGSQPQSQPQPLTTDNGCSAALQQEVVKSSPERSQLQHLKGCTIPLKVGSKVRCYPTERHWQNNWTVLADIVELRSEQGYFNGCTVRYINRKTQSKIDKFIGGGNGDWLLELIV
jgi:hypothetical protein